MIKLGDNNVTLKLGDNDVSKVYLGENQIYPSAPATNLVMQRISDTEYLVTGDSGTADLTFTRESDSFVDAKGVQSLPYTFTHTAGEKWSVNGVNAWGVQFIGNGRMHAANPSDVMFALPISFKGRINSVTGSEVFIHKYIAISDRWQLRNLSGSYNLIVRKDAGATVLDSTRTVATEYISMLVEDLGANWKITANTNTAQVADGGANVGGQSAILEVGVNFNGVVHSFSIGAKIWELKEGAGSIAEATDGTQLTIQNGTWVAI